ncbi:lanthionine synthetase C family protein [Actinocrispum wychmicini]|uniref:Lanthionine synthetase-like protein n=1 Tax=Actinocrispum wychmicini TaxID=1213861 RepID=A0A4R2JPT1_9PSEU|nr:lanthionine synthetase C family protein [Actinocrispum wychmicini]TCO62193.1 lanthionine synthetase-like protein [Actinocrispum wychmicini]
MTGVVDTLAIRVRAEAVVEDVARRLADPAVVAAVTIALSPGRWAALSLSDGYPATALLFAELAHQDPAYRAVAHQHLAIGSAAGNASTRGLYVGAGALAFAAARAAGKAGAYADMLSTLDHHLAMWVARKLRPEWERMSAGRPGTEFATYDVVTGVTGVGRHLLDRGALESTQAVLRYLVTLTEPVGRLPGWWAVHPPTVADPGGGHANTGLAHGIAGPLALISIAWAHGVRVPGQDAAAERIVDWLLTWSDTDENGRYWPYGLDTAELAARPKRLRPARSAWCYGTPGIARALHLAGTAFDRPEWTDEAVGALQAMLLRPLHSHAVTDAGLCHGWAGLLHLVLGTGRDTGAPELLAAADRIAARVLEVYDPDSAFGFRVDGTDDTAGFLEGAAGVALALLGWLGEPRSGWDAALLAA